MKLAFLGKRKLAPSNDGCGFFRLGMSRARKSGGGGNPRARQKRSKLRHRPVKSGGQNRAYWLAVNKIGPKGVNPGRQADRFEKIAAIWLVV